MRLPRVADSRRRAYKSGVPNVGSRTERSRSLTAKAESHNRKDTNLRYNNGGARGSVETMRPRCWHDDSGGERMKDQFLQVCELLEDARGQIRQLNEMLRRTERRCFVAQCAAAFFGLGWIVAIIKHYW